jgi:RNA polymerase sigma-70 factor (ECF subfamily)
VTEDEKLLFKIRHLHSEKAKNTLIDKYYNEIYVYVYRHILNVEDSMDLTQEIFVNTLRGLATFNQKKSSFRTWLYRIATNKMTDWYRCIHFTDEIPENLPDETRFEEIIENRALAQKILDFIKKKDEISHSIMELKFFSELTFKEIGEMLQLSENTVKTKYYHMIKIVREGFENNEN